MRYKTTLLSLAIGASLSFLPSNAFPEQKQNAQESIEEFIENLVYGDIKLIESFGFIYVDLQNSESNKLGLNQSELTDYLKLRYKNNFSGIPYKDKMHSSAADIKEPKKVGRLRCRVWTVGDDYPVAYHVECQLGSIQECQPGSLQEYKTSSFQENRILTDAALGYGSKRNVPDTIKRTIDEMVSRFAVKFFKVRGEM